MTKQAKCESHSEAIAILQTMKESFGKTSKTEFISMLDSVQAYLKKSAEPDFSDEHRYDGDHW